MARPEQCPSRVQVVRRRIAADSNIFVPIERQRSCPPDYLHFSEFASGGVILNLLLLHWIVFFDFS